MKHRKPTPPQKRECFWISVEDRLPKAKLDVLGFSDELGSQLAYHDGVHWRSVETECLLMDIVTHWMDLPEGPK